MRGRTKRASHLRGKSSFLQARVLEQDEVLMTSPMILIGEMLVLMMGFMTVPARRMVIRILLTMLVLVFMLLNSKAQLDS